MTINAFPLTWPAGWKRTQPGFRRSAKFNRKDRVYRDGRTRQKTADLTVANAVERVLEELGRMGCGTREDVVISTNLRLRLDGLPRSDQAEPEDRGAAVYWQEPGLSTPRVMAIDLYDRVADNLAAVAATLEAMRAIERHGGAMILERAFAGFVALPAPGTAREWWEVLGVREQATADEARQAYRRLAAQHHPDRGGNSARMAEINAAFEKAPKA